ncbi:MAG: hat [Chitinophagaceae bacterium]|nr:hat [Chitinophagaceae bacterium]
MNINYIPFQEDYKEELLDMVMSLYKEDPDGAHMTPDKIERTIEFLSSHPGAGEIVLFTDTHHIAGYAILINYWSNEYGGTVLFIDELFVKKKYRGKNVGSDFIQHLIADVHDEYQSIVLEVIPSNEQAMRLYGRLGFKTASNNFLRHSK